MVEAVFGAELRRCRQAAALSLRQLAARVGYDHSYLSQVERGQRPGSAHLARLCDSAIGTGSALTDLYARATSIRRPARPATTSAGPILVPVAARGPAQRTLEATRQGLAGALAQVSDVDEWAAVVAAYARDYTITAPPDLLPELSADLELLEATAAAVPTGVAVGLAVPAARLAALMALTLASLGRSRAARRWWRTARDTADHSADQPTRSLMRSLEATTGFYDRRPVPELLELAEQASLLADEPDSAARAVAARAQALAVLEQAGAARAALGDLVRITADRPGPTLAENSLFGWPSYRVHFVESFVYTALRDTEAAYRAQDKALELHPLEDRRQRAELRLHHARCLIHDREVAAGLAAAMRVLVELQDHWHTEFLYDAAARVLSAVPAADLGRPAVRDYRELLVRRPYQRR